MNKSKTSTRVPLVHSSSRTTKDRQKKAHQTVLLSLKGGTESSPPASHEHTEQQLCPLKALPKEFLIYKSGDRPNPVFGPRGQKRLGAFRASMSTFRSQLKLEDSPFLPQGAHPFTGQALLPLFNNAERLATGEDTALQCKQLVSSNFAFQVVNNNYMIDNPVPGTLNERTKRHNQLQSSKPNDGTGVPIDARETKKRKAPKAVVQSHFFGAIGNVVSSSKVFPCEIPRSINCVRDILQMWAFPDLSKGLIKPLKDWSASERNKKISRAKGKEVKNSKLYARRKMQAMAFFHYCETYSVEQYIERFTEINEMKVIGKNYILAPAYAEATDFKNLFRTQEAWVMCTDRVLLHEDVKKALRM